MHLKKIQKDVQKSNFEKLYNSLKTLCNNFIYCFLIYTKSIIQFRFSLSITMYVTSWCKKLKLCSILQHIDHDDQFESPILLINNKGNTIQIYYIAFYFFILDMYRKS